MSLLRPARRVLSSKSIRPSLVSSKSPWRPLQTTFQPPFRAPLFRSFSASSFFRNEAPFKRNLDQEDGLRNNRDLPDQGVPSEVSKVSSADLDLLSKLPPAPQSRETVSSYAMIFTCKKCSDRSAHKVSKQGYHEGTVLITCPGCKSRHLISDHLKVSDKTWFINIARANACGKIFSDTRVTLEDILANKGHELKKLAINEDGDLEFWEKPEAAGEAGKSSLAS